MQIVQNPSTPGHGMSLHDNRRRHDHLTRRVTHAREAGLLEATLSAANKSTVGNAARAMVQAYQANRISRQHIEEEQRADETRLKGWQVATPQPGTVHEEEIPKIKYRMAVRARALAEIASLDLAVLISTTDRHRDALPKTPAAKAWTAGSGYGSSGAKKGGPIGLREFNACHLPAGNRDGGQFAPKGQGQCSGGGGGKAFPSAPKTLDKVRRTDGGDGASHIPTPPGTMTDRGRRRPDYDGYGPERKSVPENVSQGARDRTRLRPDLFPPRTGDEYGPERKAVPQNLAVRDATPAYGRPAKAKAYVVDWHNNGYGGRWAYDNPADAKQRAADLRAAGATVKLKRRRTALED